MKNAIIIGASSGIGEALARLLSQKGFCVGLIGRCIELLAELQSELPASLKPFFGSTCALAACPWRMR